MILLPHPHQVLKPLRETWDRRLQQDLTKSLERKSRSRRAESPGTSAGGPTKTSQTQLQKSPSKKQLQQQPLSPKLLVACLSRSPRGNAGALMPPLRTQSPQLQTQSQQSRQSSQLHRLSSAASERDGVLMRRRASPVRPPLHHCKRHKQQMLS